MALLSKVWRVLSERVLWAVGALLLAFAVFKVKTAKRKEKQAHDRLTDYGKTTITNLWGDVDVEEFTKAQKKGRLANDRLNQRLDEIAAEDDDTARIISEWNAANRLHNDEGAT